MSFQDIDFRMVDGTAHLRLNRPAALNALRAVTLEEMWDAVSRAAADPSVRVLVLTGAGRAFSAGGDMSADAPANFDDMGLGLESHCNPLLLALRDFPAPVLCAVNGAAVGGGCAFALAADVVIAARSAYFLMPFARLGLVADCGASWMLPRLIGRARAGAMMLLGESVPAEQAVEWGLIHAAVEDGALEEETERLARRLAAAPTVALRLMRQTLAFGSSNTLEATLDLERANQRTAGRTAHFLEGLAAFREKRKPAFLGH